MDVVYWNALFGGLVSLLIATVIFLGKLALNRFSRIDGTTTDLWKEANRLKTNLSSHRVHAAETFVRKDEMREMRKEIIDKLDDLMREIKNKVDK